MARAGARGRAPGLAFLAVLFLDVAGAVEAVAVGSSAVGLDVLDVVDLGARQLLAVAGGGRRARGGRAPRRSPSCSTRRAIGACRQGFFCWATRRPRVLHPGARRAKTRVRQPGPEQCPRPAGRRHARRRWGAWIRVSGSVRPSGVQGLAVEHAVASSRPCSRPAVARAGGGRARRSRPPGPRRGGPRERGGLLAGQLLAGLADRVALDPERGGDDGRRGGRGGGGGEPGQLAAGGASSRPCSPCSTPSSSSPSRRSREHHARRRRPGRARARRGGQLLGRARRSRRGGRGGRHARGRRWPSRRRQLAAVLAAGGGQGRRWPCSTLPPPRASTRWTSRARWAPRRPAPRRARQSRRPRPGARWR